MGSPDSQIPSVLELQGHFESLSTLKREDQTSDCHNQFITFYRHRERHKTYVSLLSCGKSFQVYCVPGVSVTFLREEDFGGQKPAGVGPNPFRVIFHAKT